jgi:hypothetical protein
MIILKLLLLINSCNLRLNSCSCVVIGVLPLSTYVIISYLFVFYFIYFIRHFQSFFGKSAFFVHQVCVVFPNLISYGVLHLVMLLCIQYAGGSFCFYC